MKPLHIVMTISIVLNALLISFLVASSDKNNPTFYSSNERSDFPLLSPRIFIEKPNDLIINFVPLRQKLQKYVAENPYRIGVYFEYLTTGTSIGVNEKESFVPASLLKTPLAMGVYKNYEKKTITPNQVLTLTDEQKDPRFGNLWKQKSGTKLTVNETLRQLLIYSDNTAQELLLKLLTGVEIDNVFDALDIPKTRDAATNPVVTAKNYSSILRCLYLACYLTKEDSNELLTILTKTMFNDKLPAGGPPNIAVAHKIGVAESSSSSSVFTDCGIIYYPRRPYVLCVMIQSDEQRATEVIKNISKITYDFIHNQNL